MYKINFFLRKRERTPIDGAWSAIPKKQESDERISKQFSDYTDRDLNPNFTVETNTYPKNDAYPELDRKAYTFSSKNLYVKRLLKPRKR